MCRQDIADYLGLTIESISRTFTQLENRSVIALPRATRIVLRNRTALKRLAAGASSIAGRFHHSQFKIWALRGIEWVILGLKTRQSWGLQGDSGFWRGLEFGIHIGWHEHRDADGGFGIRIRFLVFARNEQCAAFSVIRKRG